MILDGWGIAPPGPGNAVSLADTPVFDELWATYPHTQLEACGPAVGLPEGQMGNSEVGHLNLGAGTVVKQDLARIDEAIADGSFFENAALRGACAAARDRAGGCTWWASCRPAACTPASGTCARASSWAPASGCPAIVLHAFTDGRDTLPTSSPEYLAQAEAWLAEATAAGVPARIGSVMGRYWAMDRDRRWDRTKRAYDALVHGEGLRADSAQDAVKMAYGRDETDEFIQPTIVGEPAPIRDGDSVLTFNFRPDRMRQIVRALGEPDFAEFDAARASRASASRR